MSLLLREALLSFRRAPLLSLLSITAIAFSLFTVGLFGLVALNLRQALRGVEERVEVVAFLLRGTAPESITLASQDIASFPEVADVKFVSEDQALVQARRELVEFNLRGIFVQQPFASPPAEGSAVGARRREVSRKAGE